MDNTTIQRIEKLHPSVRDEVKKIIEECDKVLTGRAKVRVAQGMRTFAEQDALYAKGRTTVGENPTKSRPMGSTVTKAKGGQSIHNYGFAVDIVMIIDGKTASWDTVKDWDGDKVSDWKEVVKVFKDHGWNWGGDWTSFKDLPHFDKKGFSDWKVLKNYKKDKDGYVIIK